MTQGGFFNNRRKIETMRRAAFEHAKKHGAVTMDDLRPLFPEVTGNEIGSVLRYPYFEKVAAKASTRPEAHGRTIWLWKIGPEWKRYL